MFRRFVATLLPDRTPSAVRRYVTNAGYQARQIVAELGDALAEALDEVERGIDTSPLWVLERHWGPFLAIQRNGLAEATYRLFCQGAALRAVTGGATDEVLQILSLLLPSATSIEWTPYYPKHWTVTVLGVGLAEFAAAAAFVEKRPSPIGGGISVAGDGAGLVWVDSEVLSYSSVHGAVPITGGWSSVHGASGSAEAGFAHVAKI